jgi:hypothetical protein
MIGAEEEEEDAAEEEGGGPMGTADAGIFSSRVTPSSLFLPRISEWTGLRRSGSVGNKLH